MLKDNFALYGVPRSWVQEAKELEKANKKYEREISQKCKMLYKIIKPKRDEEKRRKMMVNNGYLRKQKGQFEVIDEESESIRDSSESTQQSSVSSSQLRSLFPEMSESSSGSSMRDTEMSDSSQPMQLDEQSCSEQERNATNSGFSV